MNKVITISYCPECPYYAVGHEVMRAYCHAPVPEGRRPLFVPLSTAPPYRKDLPPPEDCPLRTGPVGMTVVLKGSP